MSEEQTEAQAEGERYYVDAFKGLEAIGALMKRKNDCGIRIALMVGRLQRAGRLTPAEVARFDAILADFAPPEESVLSARWSAAIEEAKATRVTVTRES